MMKEDLYSNMIIHEEDEETMIMHSSAEHDECCYETTITTTTIHHPLTTSTTTTSTTTMTQWLDASSRRRHHDEEETMNLSKMRSSSSEMQESDQKCYYYEPSMNSNKELNLLDHFMDHKNRESNCPEVTRSSKTLFMDHVQNCVVEISDQDKMSRKSLFKHPERVCTLFNVTSIVFIFTLLLDFYGPLFSPSFLFQTLAVSVFGMYSVYNQRQVMISFFAIFISISFAITLSETLLLTCYGHNSSGLVLYNNWFHLIRFLLTLILSLSLLIASFHVRVEVARLNALRRQFIASCYHHDNERSAMKKKRNYQVPLDMTIIRKLYSTERSCEDSHFVTQNKV
ncbi:hypothetical protein C9374_002168 [Naegleria lovaniensis]|uniref:Uncharacterized protein n=1 Tax=Naegleria lovaniensis TaxID=51637 RepID=A0AA88GWK4_NAELO|nr:uncharacterized protein C9374_002168 [Naegleria lovaniensis]KAG2387133.1 hypothetical protein C9374_002168 [Naegleria lovaniensis]